MIRIPVRSLAAAAVTLLAAGAGVALTATTASATNTSLNCLADLTNLQTYDRSAEAANQASNTAGAAAYDADAWSLATTTEQNCYYSVPYGAYTDAVQALGDLNGAESANSAGNGTLGLQYEQSAATLLSAAVTIAENSNIP